MHLRLSSTSIFVILLHAAPALAEVEADCHEGPEARTCATNRLEHAMRANAYLGHAMRNAGWRESSFGVQYLAGGDGAPDTLLVTVRGSRGRGAAAKTPSEVATADELALAADEIRKVLASEGMGAMKATLFRHVDKVQISNGQDLAQVVLEVPCHEGDCSTYRRADAEEIARLFAPVLEKAGWGRSLFGVQYGADRCLTFKEAREVRSDTIVFSLRCARGGQRPTLAHASLEDARFAREAIKKGFTDLPASARKRLLRGVGGIEVDGQSLDVSEVNPSPAYQKLSRAERERLEAEGHEKIIGIPLETRVAMGKTSSPPTAPKKSSTSDDGFDPRSVEVETSVADAARVIRRHRNEIRLCYESAFRNGETRPAGEVTVSFRITASGTIEMPRISEDSTIQEASVSECILRRVRRWMFPPVGDGGPVAVTYRFPPGEDW